MPKRKHTEDASGYENTPPRSTLMITHQLAQKDDPIRQLIKNAYLSSTFSDMTIICKDVVFHAHKLIDCSQSEYFKTACSSGFKESNEPIRLSKWPALMEKVLEYLYTGGYTVNFERSHEGSDFDTPSPCHASVGQSGSVPHSTPNAGPNEPVPSVQESSIAVSETNSEDARDESELNADEPPEDVSSSGNIVAGETPSELDSNFVFVVHCMANPAYFHAHMYAEADYFLIDGLKPAARLAFQKVFLNDPHQRTLEETIKELYSGRAWYLPLRQLAIEMLAGYLKCHSQPVPLISPEFLDSMPDFMFDLCLGLIPKGARSLADTTKAPTPSRAQ